MRPSSLTAIRVVLPVVFAATLAASAVAQTAPAPSATAATPQQAPAPPHRKNRHFVPGTPLDTIMSTRLWTDVPPAQGFVRDSRPDPKTLDYTPLSGVEPDPVRPKPRDTANVEALQAELEHDRAVNASKGNRPRPAPTHHTKQARAAD